MVERLFLAVPRGCLRLVIVVFPDHTHLLFLLPVVFKLFAYWVIFHAFLLSADFCQNQLLKKILSGILSACQVGWTQTVSKGFQQTRLVGEELIIKLLQYLFTIRYLIPL